MPETENLSETDRQIRKAVIVSMILGMIFFAFLVPMIAKNQPEYEIIVVLSVFGSFLAAFGIVAVLTIPLDESLPWEEDEECLTGGED